MASECLHCDIHDLIETYSQTESTSLQDVAAKVTEVLADLILTAPPEDRTTLMAEIVANLGSFVLEKGNPESDQTPGRRH